MSRKREREEREKAESIPVCHGAAGHRSWHGMWCFQPLSGARERGIELRARRCGAGEAGKELRTLQGCPGRAANPGMNVSETIHPAAGA